MKLGLIAALYAPEFEGGSERVVRALARGLFARGHAVQVVCGSERGSGERELVHETVDGIDVTRIPLTDAEAQAPELARPRVEALVAEALAGSELVHLHHWSTLSQRLVRTLVPRQPVVVTLHDSFATCPRFFRASPLGLACPPRGEFATCATCVEPLVRPLSAAQLEPKLRERARELEAEIRAAARWIVPSRRHGERLLEQLDLDRERQVVLPPGLTRRLQRVARKPAGPFDRYRSLRLLHFGNLGVEKGTFDIVEAVAMLPEGRATLTLAGRALTPGFEAEVERRRGQADVRITGPYDSRSLARLAAECDLAVFPTRLEESYGLVLDEAHALGLPAWTSDRGAMPERLSSFERSLPAEDPPAWARALGDVLTAGMSLEQATRRLERQSVPSVGFTVRAHEELYAAVLEEARP